MSECMRPDCAATATRWLRGKYDSRWWWVCDEHYKPAYDALCIGLAGDTKSPVIVREEAP